MGIIINKHRTDHEKHNRKENTMERRKFLGGTLAGSALLGGALGFTGMQSAHAAYSSHMVYTDDLVIERDVPGKLHKGKVLAAIQPHSDDIPIFAAGTVAKLINEGYVFYSFEYWTFFEVIF